MLRIVKSGEFISMCMMAADEPVVSSVMNTGFTDDESIRDWMRYFAAVFTLCIPGYKEARAYLKICPGLYYEIYAVFCCI